MSLFNDKLKEIPLIELFSVVIVLFIIQYLFNTLNIVQVDLVWVFIFIIFYFIFKLRKEIPYVMEDISALRDSDLIKSVVLLVILNIFVSYGVLYLSKVVGFYFPFLGSASNSFVLGIFLSSVIVSPISEELIFRGVLFNRLKIITPTVFAVLISSLLFGSLHGFGGIFSAFVFGITVAVLYLEYDNIFVPILAHFLNNLIAEIIVVLDPNKILFTDYYVIAAVSVLAIVSFIVLAHLLIHELKVLYNNEV